ncbi:MAG: uracil-DNA glycosylase [Thermodesulfobacteriota bacterium]|nr:uracil-DNA glycosylase [Thermodesulfobacteriota bacterium]
MANHEIGLEPPFISEDSLKSPDIKTDGDRRPSDQLGNAESLEQLKAFIGDCRRCKLHKDRTRLVFGEGSNQARLVFVGEGPGRDEDREGRPFVGEAGILLTKIIRNGMGLTREEVYICNVVKCRPPGNRDPVRDEIEACIPFLKQQLNIIKPEVICILGRVAGQALLKKDFKITRERGKWHSYMDIPVMPTYHPAYILRNRSRERELKGEVWEDIKKIMTRLDLEVKK